MTETARPRVSIIVLGYNGIEYLEACIGSLLDQDFPGGQYEVVYVDNKSPDASVAFVRERFPGVRIVEFTENYGYAAGNNRALGFVRGELIILLNQDTVAARSWLRALVAGMDSTPDAMVAHANIIHPWYPDFAGLAKRAEASHAYTPDLTRWGYARYRDLGQQSQPLDVLILSGASLVIRRAVLDELGYLFDEGFYSYGEDWDLGFRVRSLGYRCLLVPGATIYHMYEPKTTLRLASLTTTIRASQPLSGLLQGDDVAGIHRDVGVADVWWPPQRFRIWTPPLAAGIFRGSACAHEHLCAGSRSAKPAAIFGQAA